MFFLSIAAWRLFYSTAQRSQRNLPVHLRSGGRIRSPRAVGGFCRYSPAGWEARGGRGPPARRAGCGPARPQCDTASIAARTVPASVYSTSSTSTTVAPPMRDVGRRQRPVRATYRPTRGDVQLGTGGALPSTSPSLAAMRCAGEHAAFSPGEQQVLPRPCFFDDLKRNAGQRAAPAVASIITAPSAAILRPPSKMVKNSLLRHKQKAVPSHLSPTLRPDSVRTVFCLGGSRAAP